MTMGRPALEYDRPCDCCGTPMIGITAFSDYSELGAPRKKCIECEK